MPFFKCIVCGVYSDDGNAKDQMCAVCILKLYIERMTEN